MKRAIILVGEDWEALFIDGVNVVQGHTIEEGDRLFLLRAASGYNLTLDDFAVIEAKGLDAKNVSEIGTFPEIFDQLQEKYFE